jgi:hypothetical protein
MTNFLVSLNETELDTFLRQLMQKRILLMENTDNREEVYLFETKLTLTGKIQRDGFQLNIVIKKLVWKINNRTVYYNIGIEIEECNKTKEEHIDCCC